jgi:hypothetical protein
LVRHFIEKELGDLSSVLASQPSLSSIATWKKVVHTSASFWCYTSQFDDFVQITSLVLETLMKLGMVQFFKKKSKAKLKVR